MPGILPKGRFGSSHDASSRRLAQGGRRAGKRTPRDAPCPLPPQEQALDHRVVVSRADHRPITRARETTPASSFDQFAKPIAHQTIVTGARPPLCAVARGLSTPAARPIRGALPACVRPTSLPKAAEADARVLLEQGSAKLVPPMPCQASQDRWNR